MLPKHILPLLVLTAGLVVICTRAQERGKDETPALPDNSAERPDEANPQGGNSEDDWKDGENADHDNDDNDDEEDEDLKDREPEREFEYEVEEENVKVKVKIDYSNGDERELDWELKADEEGARITSEYFRNVNDSKASVNFQILVLSIVEYIPDSVPGFVNDTVIRKYDYWRFSPMQDLDPLSTTRSFKLSTEDGVFAVVAKLNVNPENFSHLNISMEDIKIDYELDPSKLQKLGWFSDEGTEIALQLAFISELKLKKDREESAGDTNQGRNVNSIVLNTDSELKAAYFDWLTYLECTNNDSVDIISSTMESGLELRGNHNHEISVTLVSFALPAMRPEQGNCVWDPVIGVARNTIDDSTVAPTDPSPSGTLTPITTQMHPSNALKLASPSLSAFFVMLIVIY